MDDHQTTVTEGGRLVIPAAMRKKMGLQIGESVTLRLENNELHIFSRRQALLRAQESVKHYIPQDVSLVDELIADRRREAADDQ